MVVVVQTWVIVMGCNAKLIINIIHFVVIPQEIVSWATAPLPWKVIPLWKGKTRLQQWNLSNFSCMFVNPNNFCTEPGVGLENANRAGTWSHRQNSRMFWAYPIITCFQKVMASFKIVIHNSTNISATFSIKVITFIWTIAFMSPTKLWKISFTPSIPSRIMPSIEGKIVMHVESMTNLMHHSLKRYKR